MQGQEAASPACRTQGGAAAALRCAVLGEPAEGWVTVFAVVCALGVFLL